MIVPARVQSSMTTDEFSRHPVGNGPFKFARYSLDMPSADPALSIFYRSRKIPTTAPQWPQYTAFCLELPRVVGGLTIGARRSGTAQMRIERRERGQNNLRHEDNEDRAHPPEVLQEYSGQGE